MALVCHRKESICGVGSFLEVVRSTRETLREMRNRSCACGRRNLPFLFSPLLSFSCFNIISSLSLVRPGLLTYRRPDADTVLTSSIPGDEDLQFQTNPRSLIFVFSALGCSRTDALRSRSGIFKISKLPVHTRTSREPIELSLDRTVV